MSCPCAASHESRGGDVAECGAALTLDHGGRAGGVATNHSVKLAAENKINAKNSWSLKLIDHLSELVRPCCPWW